MYTWGVRCTLQSQWPPLRPAQQRLGWRPQKPCRQQQGQQRVTVAPLLPLLLVPMAPCLLQPWMTLRLLLVPLPPLAC